MPKSKKPEVPHHVEVATAPVNEAGLTSYEEESLKRISTHRSRQDLREAFIEYKKKVSGLSEEEYLSEAEKMIWLSAYANNNPRSDYHWQCDLLYPEAVRRGGEDAPLYQQAYKKVARQVG